MIIPGMTIKRARNDDERISGEQNAAGLKMNPVIHVFAPSFIVWGGRYAASSLRPSMLNGCNQPAIYFPPTRQN